MSVPLVLKDSQRLPSTQIVIAALNEEEGIGMTIAELLDSLPNANVLVVDGKSTDRTVEIARNLGAQVVYQDGMGKGDAVSKALEYLDPAVDYVVLTDADFTYPGNRVPEMIQILEQNSNVGMVCGNRFNNHLDKQALRDVFHFGNRIIGFTHNALNSVPMHDPLTGLRVIRASILRGWKVKSKGFDIEVELNHRVERSGFDIEEIDVAYRERLGQKKLKVRHGAQIFKRIMLETLY
jgi:dolichol-phosphate mannosyltransferase